MGVYVWVTPRGLCTYIPMYTPFLHHFLLSTYLAPILASLLYIPRSVRTSSTVFASHPHSRKPVAVFISSRIRRVTAKWRKRRQEKHKELGGARKNEGPFFLPMNKGVLIQRVREKDRGSGERTCVSAKSKRERPTMGEDTWKEEKASNRKWRWTHFISLPVCSSN